MLTNADYVPYQGVRLVPGYYAEINEFGDVWSLDRIVTRANGRPHTVRGKRLRPNWQGKHWQCPVYDLSGVRRWRYIHQMVLEAHVGPRPEGLWALHRDDDPHHNHVSNLYWGTPSENTYDSVANFGHHNAQKVRCSRGHLLKGDNLASWAKDQRQCLACNRAKTLARYRGRSHDEDYVRLLADEKFAEIMKVSA